MKHALKLLCLTLATAASAAAAQVTMEDGSEANWCADCERPVVKAASTIDFGAITDTLECRSRDREACAMFIDLNRIRRESGLNALKYDSTCEVAAQGHGQDMATRHFFSHTGSDGSDLVSRYQRVNGVAAILRENLFMRSGGFASAQEANAGLMNSPGHRENILARDITHAGIARVQSGAETYYVQCFSQPAH